MTPHRARKHLEKRCIRKLTASISDDKKIRWEFFSESESEQCWINLQFGEVSGSSEDSEKSRQDI